MKVPTRWRTGVVARLSGATEAEVTIDYNSFRYAGGADWASRLTMWQLPGCALTTPEAADCQAVKLPSKNHTAEGTVTAPVGLSAVTGGALVALSAAPDGPEGDYSATPLSVSSTWSSGGATGDFSWSYPMRVPPPIGGPAPQISLSYSAQSVDGRSDATNNQPSWIGEGFEYSPGFIERKYIGCAGDMTGVHNNAEKTGDQCWRSDNATLSLNGTSTELIWESGAGWHPRHEDGSLIKKLTGAVNGDNNGEYWEVTTANGTHYFFGRNELPGQTSTTDSTYTTKVYGNNANEPCNDTDGASDFAKSSCDQAWRWNLDYVVDARGNTMSLWYDRETNNYAPNMKKTDLASYVRGGELRHIDYGTWDRGAADRSVTPRGQVVFDVDDRCKSNCADHGSNWPDTPWDQQCKSDATECENYSPTFWSTKRLSKITTKVWDTSASTPGWQDVDSWTLSHDFPNPNDGTHAGLWLSSIVHAGLVGEAKVLPPVTLAPVSMPNRMLTAHNRTVSWQRMANIVSETGAQTRISYSLPECDEDNTANLVPANNGMLCYPVIAPNPSDPDDPDITEWWHKYVVTQVLQSDTQVGEALQPAIDTHYKYVGKPAWHYADDDGFIKPSRKTWAQFRGFSSVETRVGDPGGAQTLTVTKFMRGMDEDRLAASGGKRSVTIDASIGDETVYDEDQFAGMIREQTTYDGNTSKPVSRTVNVPWRSSAKASRTINGDTVDARFVGTRVTYAGTALGDDGSRGWRITGTESSFNDTDGTAKWKQDDGDIAKTGDEQCVTYTYNNNTAANIIGLQERAAGTALACGKAAASTDDVLSDVRYTYDGASNYTTAPKYGSVTKTEQLKDWTAANGTEFRTTGTTAYDDFGRAVTTTDERGNTTTTTYTPANQPPASVTTLTGAPFNWKSTIAQAPAWGLPTTTTDVGGGVIDQTYDALGRSAKVWLLGWTKAAHKDSPSKAFEYDYPDDRAGYSSVKTTTLNAAGGYTVGFEIYDGLLRLRQTQTESPLTGSRIITDTLYDQWGNVATTYAAHGEEGVPAKTLLYQPEWTLRNIQRNVYDNAGRQRAAITLTGDGITNLVERWRTTTEHEGDLTKITPPAGGTPTTTVIDAQGRTVQLRVHTTAAGVSGASDATTYTYNRKGQLVRTEDSAGDRWTTSYDVQGRAEVQTDPDKGETVLSYNEYGDKLTSKDDNGALLTTDYDVLGRKIGLYYGAKTATNLRAKWNYDKLYTGQPAVGQLTESIRYDGSNNQYKQQVSALNTRHQVTGMNYVVPFTETGVGGSYLYSYGFSAFNGAQESMTYPSAGGLPGEKVTTGFASATGLPTKLDTSLPNVTSYVTSQEYSRIGEPTVTFRKINGGEYVQTTNSYDLATRRLSQQQAKVETVGVVADRKYEYDDAGGVLSLTDAPAVGSAEKQCFAYDYQRRLTSAWTPSTAVDCKTTAASVAGLAGPAPYWTDWTIDALGNRRKQVAHSAAGDNTQEFSVPEPGLNVVRPHAATEVKNTTPANLSVTSGFGYDEVGNMNSRTAPDGGEQTLDWSPEGNLTQVTQGTTKTTSVYDTTGSRIIQRDSTGTTLYLPGMQVKRATGATSNTATRFYTFAGVLVASRTPAADGLSWLLTDTQGTQTVSVNDRTQQCTVRRQTPYGEPRGAAAGWPNTKGFVGGDIDTTGLTHLGAREYDPTIGRFISVDPVLDLTDPQQWNGYAYANNNPTSSSDASGLICTNQDDNPCGTGTPGSGATKPTKPTKPTNNPPDDGGIDERLKQSVDLDKTTSDGLRIRGYGGSDNHTVRELLEFAAANTQNWVYLCTNLYGLDSATCEANNPIPKASTAKQLAMGGIVVAGFAGGFLCGAFIVACVGVITQGAADAGEFAASGNMVGAGGAGSLFGGGALGLKALAGGGRLADDGLGLLGRACSFSADTRVLLANGSSKKISRLRIGDRVLATDPENGRGGSRKITHVIVHNDELVSLSVNGKKVVTTRSHPFWNESQHSWQSADELSDGTKLLTSSGVEAKVDYLNASSGYQGQAYNLTVSDIHTYYVLAGNIPVLVHNTGPGCGSLWMNPDKIPHHFMRMSDEGLAHAADFGVTGPYNKVNSGAFVNAVGRFTKNPTTMQIRGTFRGQSAIHYVDPDSGLHASFAANGPRVGEYLGGWKSEGDQLGFLLGEGRI